MFGVCPKHRGTHGLIYVRPFTCFQFAYDWRRDIVESARKLDGFIKEKKLFTAAMDVPARPPETLHLYLVAGDAEDTDKISTTHWIYRILFEL